LINRRGDAGLDVQGVKLVFFFVLSFGCCVCVLFPVLFRWGVCSQPARCGCGAPWGRLLFFTGGVWVVWGVVGGGAFSGRCLLGGVFFSFWGVYTELIYYFVFPLCFSEYIKLTLSKKESRARHRSKKVRKHLPDREDNGLGEKNWSCKGRIFLFIRESLAAGRGLVGK